MRGAMSVTALVRMLERLVLSDLSDLERTGRTAV